MTTTTATRMKAMNREGPRALCPECRRDLHLLPSGVFPRHNMPDTNRLCSGAWKTPKAREKTEQGCSHYWRIDPANGPTSPGRCKYCGEISTFFNSI